MIARAQWERRGTATNYWKGIFETGEGVDNGMMCYINGDAVYVFYSTDPEATITVSGYSGEHGYDNPFSTTVNVTTTLDRVWMTQTFLPYCKDYIVNVQHQLTSEKYDLMVAGVNAYLSNTETVYYYGSQGCGVNIPQHEYVSLELTTAGTVKLEQAGDRNGQIIGKNVENIFIDAWGYQASGTENYADSQYEYWGYLMIKKAIEEDYITDPDIIDFLNDNEWVNIEETRCDWTVNIDGVKNPNITIMWNCPGIQSGDIDSGSATINMEIGTYNTISPVLSGFQTLGTFAYDKHVYNTSWAKLAKQANLPSFTKILANIMSLVGVETNVALRMHVTYYINGGMSETSVVEILLSYTGDGSGRIIPPNDGSTIRFTHTSTDEAIEEFLDDIDMDDLDDPTVTDPTLDQAFSGVGLLTRTYVLTKSRLQQLGAFLWTRDFFDYIQDLNSSPIENIVSVKMVPFNIPAGSDTEIVLGNVATGIMGKPVDMDYNCKHTIGTVTIAKKYPANCNFLNSNTFTKLMLFLPFIGFKELDADVFLDHALKVEYINDIITGNCKAVIYADNIPICDFSGQIGLDVPISAQNRAQVEMGLISAVGQGVGAIASGNVGGVASSAISLASNSFHTETRGANSPSVDSFMTHDCFYILENAIVQYPSRYNHTHGRPLNLSKTLRNVSGFTVCEDVDVSGIQGATREELDYIKDMLEKGVYL